MKIAITGGGNCYALSLAREAISQGHEVIGIGRNPMKPACFSMEFASQRRDFAYHVSPVGSDNCLRFLDYFSPDWIVNFAAQGEGAASFSSNAWPYFYNTNVADLVHFTAELAKRSYLKRFVQIGSSEVYGSVDDPAPETAKLHPSSPYAHSKACFDEALGIFHATSGFPMNIVRPSNCYVKGQQLHRIIPKTMLTAALGKKLPLHGGGRARKSYLHASDLARAVLKVLEIAPLGTVYNVGPEHPTSIRDVVEMCAKYTGVLFSSFVELVGERTGQDGCYWLDSSRIRALGWEPKVSWDHGMDEMSAWIRAYKDDLARFPMDYGGLTV